MVDRDRLHVVAVEPFRYQLEVNELTRDPAHERVLMKQHPTQVPAKVVVRISEYLMQH